MSIATRQYAVRTLEPGAFQGATGREDIMVLKQGIYEAAQLNNVLAAVALDADLLTYGLEREAIRIAPALPAHGATAAELKYYENRREAYVRQSTALSDLKKSILHTLDQAAKHIIEDPVHGVLMHSVLNILELLTAEYSTMTNKELRTLKDQWSNTRWDPTTDLITFLADFQAQLAFLGQHQFAPPVGDQVVTLQTAVEHVPLFAQMADAAFFQQFPALATQTLANLCITYRRVYRAQYANSTAAQHHAVNQVTQANNQQESTTHLDGIMASARATLRGTHITPAMMERLRVEIPRTIERCLRSNNDATQQAHGDKSTRFKRGDQKRGPQQPIVKGTCPLHPNAHTPHTWNDCRLNPENGH